MGVGAVVNGISPSWPERALWTPTCTLLALSAWRARGKPAQNEQSRSLILIPSWWSAQPGWGYRTGMPQGLSPRLAAIVDALPLAPRSRVLEIGCGTGAAARAIARRLDTGHILAIDRSAKAVAQTRAGSAAEIASGRMSVRQVAVESFTMRPADLPFDVVLAVRVGALDGRHPEVGRQAAQRITAALAPDGKVFIDGGDPLRELDLSSWV